MKLRKTEIFVLFDIQLILVGLVVGLSPENNSKSSRRLAPCQICKVLVTSFEAGIQRTQNGDYWGGDTAWEEENKKNYKNSELRLVEIQERLCSEVSVAKDQCHEIASNNEDLLEEWWLSYRNEGHDLMEWLCIDKLQVCCSDNHFGPDCKPCPTCSGHGRCKGNGTRKGQGDCSCDTGYYDEMCDSCAPLFYQSHKDEKSFTCSACHKACKNSCTGPGAKNCELCQDGWDFDEELGCIDVNECLMEEKTCKQNEYCLNTDGSYSCISCDSSCESCYGDGRDMCERCAEGFTMKDKVCIDNSSLGRESKMNTTRYFTYCGLAVVSLIVFHKNAMVASILGVSVGGYIAATEYLLRGAG